MTFHICAENRISGVEVDVRVNSVPVREDDLPAELRPVANNPQARFIHSFALQTLDLEGAHGGCDRIDVALRPLPAEGRKGEAQASMLTYVALRDVAPRTQRLGDAELKWSAAYITPQREWRHIAEVHSYIYSTRDPATQKRAVIHLNGRDRFTVRWVSLSDEGSCACGGRPLRSAFRRKSMPHPLA